MPYFRSERLIVCMTALLLIGVVLMAAMITQSGPLSADGADGQAPEARTGGYLDVSSEELAQKAILDTGWTCGMRGAGCSHILLNDSDYLLCVPTENKNGYLMIPLEHFRAIGGCGLEEGADGQPLLIMYDRAYRFEAGSPLLITEGGTLTLPLAPYEAHGFLYVPLRFLCETLSMDIQWRPESEAVVVCSPWADAEEIAPDLMELNARLLSAIDEASPLRRLEPVDVTVTFYFSYQDPPYTASGHIAEAGTLAADQGFPFGTQFYLPELRMIKEDGVFTVHDRGGSVTGELLDVFIPSYMRGDPEVQALLRLGRFKTEGYLVIPD